MNKREAKRIAYMLIIECLKDSQAYMTNPHCTGYGRGDDYKIQCAWDEIVDGLKKRKQKLDE